MLNLTGYQAVETLYTGTRTLVYRAIQLSNDLPVIIKVLRNPYPHFNELVQFRNQYTITQTLDSPHIVQPLTLERHGNGYALVMPDRGAVSLASYWPEVERDFRELLTVAIQLAAVLHTLAEQQIIHKDIKPANILIHPQTQQVQLIDFSIASLLPKEQRQLVNSRGLEGTLAYISPEQTGRMNRGIDYRSDFYSLGVTLYELLTNMRPFSVSDPLELVHCHIAQSPLAPADMLDAQGQPYPATLSAIIMKLMAKNAEDRYQTALGLQHDLERCLQSVESTGKITEFELGERDVCDRFNIPEKLYGREVQIQALLSAFERAASGSREMILVAGFSGIGKTAVVNEVHKPIVRQRGYFIKGKFDQFNRNIPFSAFVQAFQDLVGQLLGESDIELAHWRANILAAAGEKGQVLIDVIPQLESIIGTQPSVPDLSGSAAQNRFNLVFKQFVAVFTTKEHPLTLFLDDLQWADIASLNLLKALMEENQSGYLLLLGAYRDNEVFPAHPFMLTLAELEKKATIISTLRLSPLSIDSINELIADTLSCARDLSEPLTRLVYQKTKGNPFFTTQFLKELHENELITFDRDLGCWQCDVVQVQNSALTDDVVEFVAAQLRKLPQPTQALLKLAACIGTRFDLANLAIVSERNQTDAATALWPALRKELIVPQSQVYKFCVGEFSTPLQNQSNAGLGYSFLHDRVQQAAYSLINPSEIAATHLKIGRQLRDGISDRERNSNIFAVVNHLNQGHQLIEQTQEREQLAHLNRKAGIGAKKSAAYAAAMKYFQMGLSLLPSDSRQMRLDLYRLKLELYQLAAESAYLLGDSEKQSNWVEAGLRLARTELDRFKFYEVQVLALIAQQNPRGAVLHGVKVLRAVGVYLPRNPSQLQIKLGLLVTLFQMAGKSSKALVGLPMMSNPEKIATSNLLNLMGSAAATGMPELLPLITFKVITMSLRYGHSQASSISFMALAFVLCEKLNKVNMGYALGKTSLKICHKINSKASLTSTIFLWWHYVAYRKESLRNALPLLLEAYKAGIEGGNLEYAAYAFNEYFLYTYLTGCDLESLEQELIASQPAFQKLNQDTIITLQKVYTQAINNLTTLKESDPCILRGDFFDESEATNPLLQLRINIQKLILSFLFEDHELRFICLETAESLLSYDDGTIGVITCAFYGALVRLSQYSTQTQLQRKSAWKRIEASRRTLLKLAKSAPMNFLHQYQLLEAEYQRVLGQRSKASDGYDRAISSARENGFIIEEAMAHELAAKFYLNWGKEKIAAVYMQEAYYCYGRWGAKVKVNHLEANYFELLAPILQSKKIELTPIDSLATLTATLGTTSQTSSLSGNASISDALDFASVLQAAQKLSSTIELEALLGDIAQIILVNAGAQKMALLALDGQEWHLQASAEQREDGRIFTQTQAQPLTPEIPLPIRLVHYVKNTQELVLIEEVKTEIAGVLEGYLLEYQPQSALCLPLLNQGHLVAIAYLEHSVAKGVFTSDRQAIVEFLCAQAAIALQNAQLYQQAQTALAHLQQTQLQLVQSEKMSALGNLVAGVAHEINNPVGFLKGNIQPAQDYLQDLLGLIDLYQKKLPNPDADIEAELEAIDLELVREDFPKLLNSMNLGVNRIQNISNSLRTFSRKDQDDKIAFNLHEGLDSTLLILKHRTKANEHHPQVEVVKNYGNLPEVHCFPGQLNQVFMNILANALDAFDEANQDRSYQEIEANPNQIAIATREQDGQVQIRIQDNGSGMESETVERIFEQGFTTKAVGKGTGLGMAIAYQIVTEKHGGAIACQSKLGAGTTFTIALPIA